MNSKLITVGLGKKDYVVSNWWNTKSNPARRELALMTLEHYIETGNYLCIGEIVPEPGIERKNDKMILYTTQNEVVSDWIDFNKSQKGSRYVANEIRRVLYNSIRQCSKAECEKWYSPYDSLEEIKVGIKSESKTKDKKEKTIEITTDNRKDVKKDEDMFAASLLNSIVKDNKGRMKKAVR